MARWRDRQKPMVEGLFLIGLGVACVLPAYLQSVQPPSEQSVLAQLFYATPTLVVAGVVVAVRGLWTGASMISSGNLLFTGMAMLLFGACPWLWLPLLAGGESTGLLGTHLVFTMGVPGLLITLFGVTAVLMYGWT
jgi:hypothetical protein